MTERAPVGPYELIAKPVPKGTAQIWITRQRKIPPRWVYSIRVWFADKETGDMRPSTRGITVAEDKMLALRDAMIEACRNAKLDRD